MPKILPMIALVALEDSARWASCSYDWEHNYADISWLLIFVGDQCYVANPKPNYQR